MTIPSDDAIVQARAVLRAKYPAVRAVDGGEPLPARMTSEQLSEWVELAVIAACPLSSEIGERVLARFREVHAMVSAMLEATSEWTPYDIDVRCPICGVHFNEQDLRDHLAGIATNGSPEHVLSYCDRANWTHAQHPEHSSQPSGAPMPDVELPAGVDALVTGLWREARTIVEAIASFNEQWRAVDDALWIAAESAGDDRAFGSLYEKAGMRALSHALDGPARALVNDAARDWHDQFLEHDRTRT